MQLGMVGLGRMGANLVRRLVRDGHTCVVFDVNADAVTALAAESDAITGATDLDDFVAKLELPRAAWVMVPAAFAGATVMDIASRMEPGDIVIDGGNTYYRDDIDRAEELDPEGHPLHRRRHQRRRVRPRARLLPDDRRRGRPRHPPGPDLRDHRPRHRRHRPHPRPHRRPHPRGRGLPALRPGRAPATS